MAIRTDTELDVTQSPRLLKILAPSVTITIQDLHDTLRDFEVQPRNGSELFLVFSVGKGGGGVTGIALTLNDLQIYFAGRDIHPESGTVTTANANGTTLIDSTALFQSNGVNRGDFVKNEDDSSHSTVLEVVGEGELTCIPLFGGTDDDFDFGDAYEIETVVPASVTGGDLFAVDSAGATIDPILPTFGVGVIAIEQDTSPSAAPVQPTTVLEGNITWEQTMRIMLASLAGDLSGAETTTITIKATDGTTTRIVATVDASGNRNVTFLDGA